ncbi:MAG: hypothetical protein HWN68_08215 [Desulfobacterales bacterium]|nr:hypothetical protein [Desulfobacterales bacterium]
MTQDFDQPAVALLKERAREYGIPEHEVVRAWEEMKEKHRLPWYVEPTLVAKGAGPVTVVLLPAVNINLLSRLDREVPDWETISGPTWEAT